MDASLISFREGSGELLPEVEPLWKLLRNHHAQLDDRWARKILSKDFSLRIKELGRKEALQVFLAQAHERTVAYCIATANSNREGEIDSIFILNDFRGQGLGDQLLTKALQWLRELEVEAIVVSVLPANEEAIRFYERRGFCARSVRMINLGDSEDVTKRIQ